jgi:hypothetical protein
LHYWLDRQCRLSGVNVCHIILGFWCDRSLKRNLVRFAHPPQAENNGIVEYWDHWCSICLKKPAKTLRLPLLYYDQDRHHVQPFWTNPSPMHLL